MISEEKLDESFGFNPIEVTKLQMKDSIMMLQDMDTNYQEYFININK